MKKQFLVMLTMCVTLSCQSFVSAKDPPTSTGSVTAKVFMDLPKQLSATVPMKITMAVVRADSPGENNQVMMPDKYAIYNNAKEDSLSALKLESIQIERASTIGGWKLLDSTSAENEESDPRALSLMLDKQPLQLGENAIDYAKVEGAMKILPTRQTDGVIEGPLFLHLSGKTGKAAFDENDTSATTAFLVTYVISESE